MRLISFLRNNADGERGQRLGALLPADELVIDFQAVLSSTEIDAKLSPPTNYLDWFDKDARWFSAAKQAFDRLAASVRLESALEQGIVIPRGEIQIIAPVPRPSKVICIGLNYRDHAAESKMPVPTSPIIFSKFVTSITGPDQPVFIPYGSSKVDYEAELAVVIGRRAKRISVANALDYVLGYTNFNDVSARDFQFADGQWQRGKSCDTFAPIGEYIATTDEIPDPGNLAIALRVNGQTMQNSRTDQLIFSVPELVAFLSQTITLEPGDVIATGTPPGVGFARKPPVFMQPGDVMEVEIEGLGILRNTIAVENAG